MRALINKTIYLLALGTIAPSACIVIESFKTKPEFGGYIWVGYAIFVGFAALGAIINALGTYYVAWCLSPALR